jgi:superfamily II DNA helicase RecQ
MILLSPEELMSWQFAQLLEQKEFSGQVCVLGVDEIHLLHWWGKSFWPAFWQIANLCACLPKIRGHQLPVVAVTATLWVGMTMDEVTRILGLSPGCYHLICWSNM